MCTFNRVTFCMRQKIQKLVFSQGFLITSETIKNNIFYFQGRVGSPTVSSQLWSLDQMWQSDLHLRSLLNLQTQSRTAVMDASGRRLGTSTVNGALPQQTMMAQNRPDSANYPKGAGTAYCPSVSTFSSTYGLPFSNGLQMQQPVTSMMQGSVPPYSTNFTYQHFGQFLQQSTMPFAQQYGMMSYGLMSYPSSDVFTSTGSGLNAHGQNSTFGTTMMPHNDTSHSNSQILQQSIPSYLPDYSLTSLGNSPHKEVNTWDCQTLVHNYQQLQDSSASIMSCLNTELPHTKSTTVQQTATPTPVISHSNSTITMQKGVPVASPDNSKLAQQPVVPVISHNNNTITMQKAVPVAPPINSKLTQQSVVPVVSHSNSTVGLQTPSMVPHSSSKILNGSNKMLQEGPQQSGTSVVSNSNNAMSHYNIVPTLSHKVIKDNFAMVTANGKNIAQDMSKEVINPVIRKSTQQTLYTPVSQVTGPVPYSKSDELLRGIHPDTPHVTRQKFVDTVSTELRQPTTGMKLNVTCCESNRVLQSKPMSTPVSKTDTTITSPLKLIVTKNTDHACMTPTVQSTPFPSLAETNEFSSTGESSGPLINQESVVANAGQSNGSSVSSVLPPSDDPWDSETLQQPTLEGKSKSTAEQNSEQTTSRKTSLSTSSQDISVPKKVQRKRKSPKNSFAIPSKQVLVNGDVTHSPAVKNQDLQRQQAMLKHWTLTSNEMTKSRVGKNRTDKAVYPTLEIQAMVERQLANIKDFLSLALSTTETPCNEYVGDDPLVRRLQEEHQKYGRIKEIVSDDISWLGDEKLKQLLKENEIFVQLYGAQVYARNVVHRCILSTRSKTSEKCILPKLEVTVLAPTIIAHVTDLKHQENKAMRELLDDETKYTTTLETLKTKREILREMQCNISATIDSKILTEMKLVAEELLRKANQLVLVLGSTDTETDMSRATHKQFAVNRTSNKDGRRKRQSKDGEIQTKRLQKLEPARKLQPKVHKRSKTQDRVKSNTRKDIETPTTGKDRVLSDSNQGAQRMSSQNKFMLKQPDVSVSQRGLITNAETESLGLKHGQSECGSESINSSAHKSENFHAHEHATGVHDSPFQKVNQAVTVSESLSADTAKHSNSNFSTSNPNLQRSSNKNEGREENLHEEQEQIKLQQLDPLNIEKTQGLESGVNTNVHDSEPKSSTESVTSSFFHANQKMDVQLSNFTQPPIMHNKNCNALSTDNLQDVVSSRSADPHQIREASALKDAVDSLHSKTVPPVSVTSSASCDPPSMQNLDVMNNAKWDVISKELFGTAALDEKGSMLVEKASDAMTNTRELVKH